MVNWSGAIANKLPNGLNCELHILYNTSYRQCYALKDTFGVILFIPFFKKGKKDKKDKIFVRPNLGCCLPQFLMKNHLTFNCLGISFYCEACVPVESRKRQ